LLVEVERSPAQIRRDGARERRERREVNAT
jgi:hypothetical protein